MREYTEVEIEEWKKAIRDVADIMKGDEMRDISRILKSYGLDFEKECAKLKKETMEEDTMKDRIQIDGIWYKREDTLLKTDETLRIISVEPFYRENGEYLRLMFDMPSAKFNVGDELAIHNLTKLRELKEKSFAKIQKGY